MIASFQQNIFVFLTQILLAKFLGPEQFGKLAFMISVMAIYTIIGTGGLSQYFPAFAKRRLKNRLPHPYHLLRWTIATACIFSIINFFLHQTGTYEKFEIKLDNIYLWISLYIIVECWVESLYFTFIEYGKVSLFLKVNIIHEALKFALPLLLIMADASNLGNIMKSWVLIAVAFAFVNFVILQKINDFGKYTTGKFLQWRTEQTEALTYMLPSSGRSLIPKLIIFLTGCLYSPEHTANVAIAIAFTSIFVIFLQPFQTAILSHLQSYTNATSLRNFVNLASFKLIALILSLSFLTIMIGKICIVPLFGLPYIKAKSILIILTLLFALEWPKSLFDIFWITHLSEKMLTSIELVKLSGIVLIFIALGGDDFQRSILLLCVLFGIINVIKGAKIFYAMRKFSLEHFSARTELRFE